MNMTGDPHTSATDALTQSARAAVAWLNWCASQAEPQTRKRSLLRLSKRRQGSRQAIQRLRTAAAKLRALANAHVDSYALKSGIISALQSAEQSLTILYGDHRSSPAGKESLGDVRNKLAELRASWAGDQSVDVGSANTAGLGAATNESSESRLSYQN